MSRARDLGSSINSTAAGKNLVINGGFDIWQRGISSSASGSVFVADRWNTYRGGYASGITVSRQTVSDTTNLPNLQYCLRVQRDSGNTSTAALGVAHNIESINSLPLIGRTVTLSFWARAGATFISNGCQLRAFIVSGTGTDEACRNGLSNMTFPGDRYISLTNSWVRYSVTGTVANNMTQVCVGLDGTAQGTAGATDYYEVTGVQLEIGSSPTSFSRAGGDLQGELAKCQRYYQVLGDTNAYWNASANYLSGFNNSYFANIYYPTQMRAAPSFIFADEVGNSAKVSGYNSSGAKTDNLTLIANVTNSWFRPYVTGNYSYLAARSLAISAEL